MFSRSLAIFGIARSAMYSSIIARSCCSRHCRTTVDCPNTAVCSTRSATPVRSMLVLRHFRRRRAPCLKRKNAFLNRRQPQLEVRLGDLDGVEASLLTPAVSVKRSEQAGLDSAAELLQLFALSLQFSVKLIGLHCHRGLQDPFVIFSLSRQRGVKILA